MKISQLAFINKLGAVNYGLADSNDIETTILPLYDDFDAAHQRSHVDMVIEQSMAIAQNLNVNEDMVYAIAAYHDTGLTADRKTHHQVSGLCRGWLSPSLVRQQSQRGPAERPAGDYKRRATSAEQVRPSL